jgi:flagellar motility protein MotE (MotC chaperone)
MRTVHRLLLVGGALLCVEAAAPGHAAGQQVPSVDRQVAQAQPLPDLPRIEPLTGSLAGAGQPKHQQLQAESARLAKQYAKSEKEEEKKEIRKKLGEVLGQQFDLHLQEQQKELDELEKQIANLKTLLKKRKDSRTTIIDRRLEQLVQDAEGLGWNTPGNRTPNAPLYSNHNAGTEYTAPARR